MWIWQHTDWPKFFWDREACMPRLLEATAALSTLLGKMQAMSLPHRAEAEAEVLMQNSMDTSKIEGELLNRDSVRSSVFRHLGLETGLHIPIDRATDGLVQVLIDARQNLDHPLTHEQLFSWHAALFPSGYSGIHKIVTGAYRDQKVEVISGHYDKIKVHYEAPPAQVLPSEMSDFLQWFNEDSQTLNGLIRAGLSHLYFEIIHPFDDGNGRLGRAILDRALAQYEKQSERFYSVASTLEHQRKAYYHQLEAMSTSLSLDVTAYLSWFFTILTCSAQESEFIIGKVFSKALFWQTHVHTSFSTHQRKVLNKMLDADPFIGGMTTKKYVSLTGVSRATAYRELAELVQKTCLKRIKEGAGRNTAYEIAF